MMRRLCIATLALLCLSSAALGQEAMGAAAELIQSGGLGGLESPAALSGSEEPGVLEQGRLSTAVEIALLLTVLSLLPAVLVTITSFTRIVIVLSFVRRALSVNDLPPNPVLLGLALFLTMFVMAPVANRVHTEAWAPYQAGEKSLAEASGAAWDELSEFLVANTRQTELALFAEIAHAAPPEMPEEDQAQQPGTTGPIPRTVNAEISQATDLPITVIVPAFILSEMKTAFQMGFLLFLPFLVIDLVVSSVLLSMGMFMLPPVMISTPIKILVFVLVDGWHLIAESVVTSFAV